VLGSALDGDQDVGRLDIMEELTNQLLEKRRRKYAGVHSESA
jgi:hypothetical protein